jgi:nicotinamide riboside kinase
LLEQGTNYTYDDLLTIAKGQLALEEKYIKRLTNEMRPANKESPTLLFVDTDMYVMKVWCEYVFNKCHLFILNKIQEQQCSLYLLCNPDLQWVKDELREYPDLKSREELYHIYKDILINQSVPWVEIKGNYDKRFDTAMKAIDALLTSSS